MAESGEMMAEIEATGARLVAAREMIARRIVGQEPVHGLVLSRHRQCLPGSAT